LSLDVVHPCLITFLADDLRSEVHTHGTPPSDSFLETMLLNEIPSRAKQITHPVAPYVFRRELYGLRRAKCTLPHSYRLTAASSIQGRPPGSTFVGTGVSVPHVQHQRQKRRCGRPWFPPFAKNAKDGAPSSDSGAVEVKINVKGDGSVSVLRGRCFAPLTGAPVSTRAFPHEQKADSSSLLRASSE
jgi:hypothetical protein